MEIMAKILEKGEEDYNICKLQEFIKNNANISECGAIYSFEGIVRGVEPGKVTQKIKLSTTDKESCQEELKEILNEVKEKYGILNLAVVHYLGEFEIGESLFLTMVAGAHRQETQKALNEVVERVKYELDFKKEEKTEEGTNIIMSGG
ncbi:MAG: molybdenum cofactor biosynthesis protein MoaE [Methanobacterium sp.]|nr:molybdenum cofactor biosynthesis protein MoaE [Methanobacterium sp.]